MIGAVLENVVCNESQRENNIPASEQFGLHRPSLGFSRICLYANVPTFLHLLCVTLCEFNLTDMHPCASYGAVVCMPPRQSFGVAGCGARRNMTSVPSSLWGVLRQSGGKQACRRLRWRGAGVLGGHVLLLSHVALGTVAGGEKNTTHRELWVWGAG